MEMTSAPTRRFQQIESRDQLQEWARHLHRVAPVNKYFKAKIPWRTILVSLLFFIGGIIFLSIGISTAYEEGSFANCYEHFIMGSILFIPGSYHTVCAFMALRGYEGWDYENLTTFESEQWHNED